LLSILSSKFLVTAIIFTDSHYSLTLVALIASEMEEIEKLVLSDKSVEVDDNVLSSILKEKMLLWKKLLSEISVRYKESSGSWNYYKDGNQWLFKMVQKKKTLFWGAVHSDSFRITFYFGDKAEPVLDKSNLPLAVKENFKTAKRYGSIRAISIKVVNNDDLLHVFTLAEIKSKLK